MSANDQRWKPIDMLTSGEHSRIIAEQRCTWCGNHADEFSDALSEKEYRISGLWQDCQDDTFDDE
jgi:hypothetical protein